jgi:hypothetical protein
LRYLQQKQKDERDKLDIYTFLFPKLLQMQQETKEPNQKVKLFEEKILNL